MRVTPIWKFLIKNKYIVVTNKAAFQKYKFMFMF